MKVKNLFLAFFACSLFILGFTACSDDDKDVIDNVMDRAITSLEFVNDNNTTLAVLSGQLTWKKPVDESVTKVVFYASQDGETKGVKIGEASVSAELFKIPANTAYTPAILAVSVLANGAEDIYSVKLLIDKGSDTQITSLEFVNVISSTETLNGELKWKKPADATISKVVFYTSKDGVTKANKIGEVAVADEKFTIPANIPYASYILAISVLANGSEDIHRVKLDLDRNIFILNSGKKGSNNASLSLYNETTGGVTYKIFATANGKGLGDTGQSVVVYGSKVYVSVSTSEIIYVLNKSGKILGEIKPTRDGKSQQPRNLTAYNGKVYTTLYDGYLAKIDTTKLAIEAQVKVGRNPEYVRVANNKLYVANSGGADYNTAVGYDKTVSVVDVKSFKELKKLDVVMNPDKLSDADSDGDIYLISNGNYKEVPNTLQRIDTKKDEVSTVTAANATWMSMNNDKLYLIYSQYDANWNQTISYMVYDAKNEKLITDKFITDGTVVARPYSISTNPANGNVYIGTSDYKTNGDMFVFNSAGKLIKKFDTGGLNPMGAYFLNN